MADERPEEIPPQEDGEGQEVADHDRPDQAGVFRRESLARIMGMEEARNFPHFRSHEPIHQNLMALNIGIITSMDDRPKFEEAFTELEGGIKQALEEDGGKHREDYWPIRPHCFNYLPTFKGFFRELQRDAERHGYLYRNHAYGKMGVFITRFSYDTEEDIPKVHIKAKRSREAEWGVELYTTLTKILERKVEKDLHWPKRVFVYDKPSERFTEFQRFFKGPEYGFISFHELDPDPAQNAIDFYVMFGDIAEEVYYLLGAYYKKP